MRVRNVIGGSLRFLAACTILAVGLATVACGDDDDDSQPTPQATPQATRPAASPSGDAAAGYRAKAAEIAKKLDKEATTLLGDMQTASTSQSDPKWPGVLNADADLIIAAAKELKALPPPEASLAEIAKALGAAADQLSQGADLLKQSVQKRDDGLGAQAFMALSTGKGALAQALTALSQAK